MNINDIIQWMLIGLLFIWCLSLQANQKLMVDLSRLTTEAITVMRETLQAFQALEHKHHGD